MAEQIRHAVIGRLGTESEWGLSWWSLWDQVGWQLTSSVHANYVWLLRRAVKSPRMVMFVSIGLLVFRADFNIVF